MSPSALRSACLGGGRGRAMYVYMHGVYQVGDGEGGTLDLHTDKEQTLNGNMTVQFPNNQYLGPKTVYESATVFTNKF